MSSSSALVQFDRQLSAANANADLVERNVQLTAELDALEPVIGAAVMVVTAFKLRDENSLIDTLRLLTRAVTAWEDERAAEDA